MYKYLFFILISTISFADATSDQLKANIAADYQQVQADVLAFKQYMLQLQIAANPGSSVLQDQLTLLTAQSKLSSDQAASATALPAQQISH